MPTSTEIFINAELPKRPYTNQFPFTSGHVPVATGVGLQVEARALTTSDISDMSNYATQEDLSNVLAGLWDDRGAYTVNAAGNINYPSSAGSGVAGALMKGDIFTVAGAVAGISTINNIAVNNGDTVRALVDNPGATDNAHWAIAENNIGYVPENRANKTTNTDLSGATGTYPDTPTVKSYIDNYDISAASINSTGTVTLTRTASDLTFQVPTAISGLSFDANTGVLTSSYTNNATSTTITVAANEVSDNVFRIKDNDDATKKIAFEASGITAGETKTITMPNANVDLGQQFISSSYSTSTGAITFGKANGTNTTVDMSSVRRYVNLPSGIAPAQPNISTLFSLNGSTEISIGALGNGKSWEFQSSEDVTLTLTKGTSSPIVDNEGNILANSGTSSYAIALAKYSTLKVTSISNYWVVDYGPARLFARSQSLGLVSTAGPGAGQTKYKTTFVRSSGSGFASDVTVTIPDKDVDLGTISSVAATDGHTLSGTRTRILGGNGNIVSGTGNIVIGAKNCLINGTDNKVYGSSLLNVASSLSNCTFNSVLNEYGSTYGNSYSQPLFSNIYRTNTLDGVTFSGWLNPIVTSIKWPKGYEVRGYKTTTLQNTLASVHTKAYVILNTVFGQPNANVVISDDTSRKPVGLCDEAFTPFINTVLNKNSCHRLRVNGFISGAGTFRLEREIFVDYSGTIQISTPVADYVGIAGVTLTVTASVAAAATAGGFYRDITINVSHNHSLAGYILGTGTLESDMFNLLIVT